MAVHSAKHSPSRYEDLARSKLVGALLSHVIVRAMHVRTRALGESILLTPLHPRSSRWRATTRCSSRRLNLPAHWAPGSTALPVAHQRQGRCKMVTAFAFPPFHGAETCRDLEVSVCRCQGRVPVGAPDVCSCRGCRRGHGRPSLGGKPGV